MVLRWGGDDRNRMAGLYGLLEGINYSSAEDERVVG